MYWYFANDSESRHRYLYADPGREKQAGPRGTGHAEDGEEQEQVDQWTGPTKE